MRSVGAEVRHVELVVNELVLEVLYPVSTSPQDLSDAVRASILIFQRVGSVV